MDDSLRPDDLDGFVAACRRVMASGQAGEAEARSAEFDGKYRWLLSLLQPLRDVRQHREMVRRQHRHRRAKARQETLQKSEGPAADAERELRLTIDTTSRIGCNVRARRNAQFVNRTVARLRGPDAEEATGERYGVPHYHSDDVEPKRQGMARFAASGEPLDDRSSRTACRWAVSLAHIRRVPLRDEKGNIVRWYSSRDQY